MEDIKIREWVSNCDGSSAGSGRGSVDGSGNGAGNGSGLCFDRDWAGKRLYGCGYGDGVGSGNANFGVLTIGLEPCLECGYGVGFGCGWAAGNGTECGFGGGSFDANWYGFGLKSLNGKTIFMIDDIPTIITHIKQSLAKGFIVESDLTMKPCYVAKGNEYFAHGNTAKEAQEALAVKIYENMEPDEAISKLVEIFEKGKKYKGQEFLEWHHYLTGSSKSGQESFVRNNGFYPNDLYTVEEFIAAFEDEYGGEFIERLKEKYGIHED